MTKESLFEDPADAFERRARELGLSKLLVIAGRMVNGHQIVVGDRRYLKVLFIDRIHAVEVRRDGDEWQFVPSSKSPAELEAEAFSPQEREQKRQAAAHAIPKVVVEATKVLTETRPRTKADLSERERILSDTSAWRTKDAAWMNERAALWKTVRANIAAIDDSFAILRAPHWKAFEAYFMKGTRPKSRWPLEIRGKSSRFGGGKFPTIPLVFRIWFHPEPDEQRWQLELEETIEPDFAFSLEAVRTLGGHRPADPEYGGFGGLEERIYRFMLGDPERKRLILTWSSRLDEWNRVRDDPTDERIEMSVRRPHGEYLFFNALWWIADDGPVHPRPWVYFVRDEIFADLDRTRSDDPRDAENLLNRLAHFRRILAAGVYGDEKRRELGEWIFRELERGHGPDWLQAAFVKSATWSPT